MTSLSYDAPLRKAYLVALEPSGDLLGSRLMRAWRRSNPSVVFRGLGGETMQKQLGFKSLFEISDLSLMGFWEVVPKIPLVLKRLRQTVADIKDAKPDVIVTIDSFGFADRLWKALDAKGVKIPRVHYVAPQVWAWHADRARKMAGKVDLLLTLLPFEPPYFTPHGISAEFVGHPVIEGGSNAGDASVFRKKYGISELDPLLCLLPGSRKQEILKLLPVFKDTVALLSRKVPGLRLVLPTVAALEPFISAETESWPLSPVVVVGEEARYNAFAASRAALAASGTVSLELARAKVPHLIAYRTNPVTAWLAKKLVKLSYANLINIVENQEIIPEFLLSNCVPEKIAPVLLSLLTDTGKQAEQIRRASAVLEGKLQNGGRIPSDLAVQRIEALL